MDGINAIDDVNRDCRSIAAPCKTIHKALSQMAADEEINTLLTNCDSNQRGYLPVLKWAQSKVPLGAPAFQAYTLQVNDQADFTSPLYDLADLTGTTFTFPTPVPGNLKLYWRVRACNVNGDCSWWSTRSFRTAILPPSLSSPGPGQILTITKPDFDWSDVEGASGCTILISTYANCSGLAPI